MLTLDGDDHVGHWVLAGLDHRLRSFFVNACIRFRENITRFTLSTLLEALVNKNRDFAFPTRLSA
jgi:hypothetical protein